MLWCVMVKNQYEISNADDLDNRALFRPLRQAATRARGPSGAQGPKFGVFTPPHLQ